MNSPLVAKVQPRRVDCFHRCCVCHCRCCRSNQCSGLGVLLFFTDLLVRQTFRVVSFWAWTEWWRAWWIFRESACRCKSQQQRLFRSTSSSMAQQSGLRPTWYCLERTHHCCVPRNKMCRAAAFRSGRFVGPALMRFPPRSCARASELRLPSANASRYRVCAVDR